MTADTTPAAGAAPVTDAAGEADNRPDLLSIKDLVTAYPTKGFRSKPFQVLHGVSLNLKAGETLGLVGESGSGKTTIGRAVLGLAPVTSGTITFEGEDISHATRADRRKLSRHMQVVFQDPYTSLNPAMTVGDILSEPLGIQGIKGEEARARVKVLLDTSRSRTRWHRGTTSPRCLPSLGNSTPPVQWASSTSCWLRMASAW